MTDFDPWALSTGLSEVVSGEITDAFFSFDNSYDNGNTCVLKLTVQDQTLGEQTLLYPCKDFEPYDNGEKVRHTSGEARNYNAQSGMGLLLKSAMDAGLGDQLRAKGDPFTAAIWKGLNVTFRNKEFKFKPKGEQEERSYSRMLIAEAGVGSTTTEAPAESNEMADTIAMLPAALRGKLKAAASLAADSNEFVEKVFTDTSIEVPSEIESVVVDPAFYEALKAS
jgi:hypothetical protein